MNFRAVYGFLFVVGATSGCATVSDDISLEKITPKQRVYVGKFKVNFNGNENPKCEIYLNYDVAPSIKLSADGFVFYKTDRESLKFRSLACYHQATNYLGAWHHQELPLTAVERSSDNLAVTYFGDIKINWKIDPDSTRLAAEKDYDSRTPSKIGRVNESGELKVEVSDGQAEVEKVFFLKNSDASAKGFHIQTSLIGIKKD